MEASPTLRCFMAMPAKEIVPFWSEFTHIAWLETCLEPLSVNAVLYWIAP